MKKNKVERFISFTLAVVMMFGLFVRVPVSASEYTPIEGIDFPTLDEWIADTYGSEISAFSTEMPIAGADGFIEPVSDMPEAKYDGPTGGKFIAPIDAPDPDAIPIYTAQDLWDVRNNLRSSYVLMNNIDLSTINGGEWIPIGIDFNRRFIGKFDGQGFIINNLKITSSDYDINGLFGIIDGATIKNLGIENTIIDVSRSSGSGYAGTIAGRCDNGYIINCYNTGFVSLSSSGSNYSYAGGICGYSYSTISKCYNLGSVSGSAKYTGGISGVSFYTSDCFNSGIISSFNSCIGGISGEINGDTINCYNEGSVSGYTEVGGICGRRNGDSHIKNCYNIGAVSASSFNMAYAGGICGTVIYGTYNFTLSNCYNTGSVSASNSTFVNSVSGGICGITFLKNSVIEMCYNTGSILASISGGICGANRSDISRCYNTGTIFAYTNAGGICGINDGAIIDSGAIRDCFNAGSIRTSLSDMYTHHIYAGGIVGNSDVAISNSYNTGSVSASSSSSSAGGICGDSSSTISNCYWNIGSAQIVNGSPVVDKKGVGYGTDTTTPLTTAQMQQEESFAGWDFKNIWEIKPEVGRPTLRGPDKVYIHYKGTHFQKGTIVDDIWASVSKDSQARPIGDEIQWTSSDPSVAKIESVTAAPENITSAKNISIARVRILKAGKTKIRASLPDGIYDEFELTVEIDATRLIMSGNDWNQARRNYAEILKTEADKESKKENTAEDAAALTNAAERILKSRVTLSHAPMDAEIIKYCYKAIMDMFAETNGFEDTKIKLSDISMSGKIPKIEQSVINAILKSVVSYDKIFRYGEGNRYEIRISITGISGTFTGSITVKDRKNKGSSIVMINSSISSVTTAINEYMEEIVKMQRNNLKAYLISVPTELGKYLGLANPKDVLKFKFASKANDALETFGLGDINLTLGKCATYYEHVNKILKASAKADLTQNAQGILNALPGIMFEDYTDTLSNKAVEKAITRLTQTKNKLIKEAEAYLNKAISTDDNNVLPTSYKNMMKIYINCPVDVYVYDENGTEIGYIEGEDIYNPDTDAVILEKHNDSKIVYRSENSKISIKTVGTEYGTLNYAIEEYVDGIAMERIVFYDIDLHPEKEIAADINFGSINEIKDTFVLSDGESMITSDEHLTAIDETDKSFSDIKVVCTDGGTVYGGSYHGKGYPVSLTALSDDGYEFAGWFSDDELLSNNASYSFTVKEDITLAARFVESIEIEEGRIGLDTIKEIFETAGYEFDEHTRYVTNILPNTLISEVEANLSNTAALTIINSDAESEYIGTGSQIYVENEIIAIIIVCGDLNGDGTADIADAQIYLESLVGNTTLTDNQLSAVRLAAEDYDNDDSAIRKLRKFLQFILQPMTTE